MNHHALSNIYRDLIYRCSWNKTMCVRAQKEKMWIAGVTHMMLLPCWARAPEVLSTWARSPHCRSRTGRAQPAWLWFSHSPELLKTSSQRESTPAAYSDHRILTQTSDPRPSKTTQIAVGQMESSGDDEQCWGWRWWTEGRKTVLRFVSRQCYWSDTDAVSMNLISMSYIERSVCLCVITLC